MGRRGMHSKEEFRELSLATMEAHLVEHDASMMSLRKLAKAIGYAPGMVLSVFKSYALFLLEVNARTLDAMTLFIDEALSGSEHLPKSTRLCLIAEAYLSFAEHHPHRWRLVFEHKMPDSETLPDWMQKRIDGLFLKLSEYLAFDGKETDEDREKVIKTLWASVHGITLLSIDDKLFVNSGMDGRVMIQSLVENFMSGNKKGR